MARWWGDCGRRGWRDTHGSSDQRSHPPLLAPAQPPSCQPPYSPRASPASRQPPSSRPPSEHSHLFSSWVARRRESQGQARDWGRGRGSRRRPRGARTPTSVMMSPCSLHAMTHEGKKWGMVSISVPSISKMRPSTSSSARNFLPRLLAPGGSGGATARRRRANRASGGCSRSRAAREWMSLAAATGTSASADATSARRRYQHGIGGDALQHDSGQCDRREEPAPRGEGKRRKTAKKEPRNFAAGE
jgi:hypothetical protein